MSSLLIENFTKHYGDSLALTITRWELHAGIYWVRGGNGSGKTTLFRALGGLHPCEGTVRFNDGVELHIHPVEFRKRVNYSEAEPLFPAFLTPKELIRFIGWSKNATPGQQDYYTRFFGVKDFFEKPCGQLSSGMLKKVSLTLAFLGEPQLIILDEPLITLDDESRELLLQAIQETLKERNVMFLTSSHQEMDAQQFNFNQVVRLNNKTLEYVG